MKSCHVIIEGWFLVFNSTFNNISVISWCSILLVEETGIPGEIHRQTLSHNVELNRVRTHNFSGDRHCLIQLPYDHDYDGPYNDRITFL